MIGIKNQQFGVEIEFTGITRHEAARALADYFHTAAVYLGGGYDAWGVSDLTGRQWKIMSDGSIRGEQKVDDHYIRTGDRSYQVEFVTPVLHYFPVPKPGKMVCGDEGRMILSRQDIDTMADQILMDFQSCFRGYGQFPRTDIDLLAGAYLDLRVHYHTLSADGNLLGVTAYDAVDVRVDQDRTLHLERDTVLLERQFLDRRGTPKQWDSLARRRAFTLAHECSHQIIFRMETAAVKDKLRKRYSGCRRYDCRELKNHEDWNEWQADTLGAALLMPRMYIQKYFAEYQQNQPLVSYGGAYAARERLAITHLMSFFGVSKAALEIRLKGLGYLKILPRYLYHDPWDIYK